MRTEFQSENLKGRDYLGDIGVDGDNIKRDFKEERCGSVDWIQLVRDRDQWRAFLNTDSSKVGKFLDQLSDHQFVKKELSAPWSQSHFLECSAVLV
jgi:hypothetical protein